MRYCQNVWSCICSNKDKNFKANHNLVVKVLVLMMLYL